MNGLFKSEFPPLLVDGLHPLTMAALRQLCLANFQASMTRPAIMQGLEDAIETLVEARIGGELWIDGSFLTEKIDPEDVDVTLRIDADFMNELTPEQALAINWFTTPGEARKTHYCHGFVWVDYPNDHPSFAFGQNLRTYWLRQFGLSRSNEKKGIAVVQLP